MRSARMPRLEGLLFVAQPLARATCGILKSSVPIGLRIPYFSVRVISGGIANFPYCNKFLIEKELCHFGRMAPLPPGIFYIAEHVVTQVIEIMSSYKEALSPPSH